MAMGAVASPKVCPMPLSGIRVRNHPVVRGRIAWEWEDGVCLCVLHRTRVRASFVCMKRSNFAAVLNARNAMHKKTTRGRTRIAKRKENDLTV